ncbi:GNAT family N-acetyltransferase [Tenacibaculum maritimum]|uniref:GNAT family N-acetyltransferase n=1 Tax=Tenacibaculum maritimum TaxID=107401 RepID=UPI0012E42BDB|nr:GNAT family N-acetyltransferase [Tenacibaculum maritimum]CAA0242554.1 conserved hypothetical protein [Tenacibaculum maritimum]
MTATLKNPVWYSLCETHKKHTIDYDGVKFYNPKISSFGAFLRHDYDPKVLNEYAKLAGDFFLVSEKETPSFDASFIQLNKKMEGCQMVLNKFVDCEITEEITVLTEKHLQEIYNLVWLVMPGYYKKHTFYMGAYFGIFKDQKLVAITGQRMQTNSFIEVSSVVTHPEYTRKGFAKQLVAHTTKEILKAQKTPILHTTKGNSTIKLYENLGYNITRDMNWWYFRKK